MTVRSLLSILADGKFHSGQELGDSLGVSRSAIWKHMRRLEEGGLELYSVKGRGYRIPGGLELLNIDGLRSGLQEATLSQLGDIDLQLSTASTNLLAMQATQKGNCHGQLYLAEQQTAGRGRRGREWVSPFARNLYLSLVWRFEEGVAALEGLSLSVGLALVKALEQLGIQGVQLKWPNDLMFEQRKLAGILLEVTGEASGECQVVIGVGINVAMSMEGGGSIDQPWIDLESISKDKKVSRNQVLGAILDQLVLRLNQFSRGGFAQSMDEWQRYNVHQGKEITLHVGNEQVVGVCRGVDGSGALLLESDKGLSAYHGGEISIQRSL